MDYNGILMHHYSGSDFLCHHGIKGQKWGIRRFQNSDGSLTAAGKERYLSNTQVNSAAKAISELYKTINSFEYGTIINGKRYGEEELSEVDWSKYRTIPIETIKKEKIGNCWDFVNYQHSELDKAGIPNKNYMFVMARSDAPDDIVTHTFTIASIGNQNKWIESAMWSKRGIHDVSGPENVVKILSSVYGEGAYDLYEFNPDGMDNGLTDKEYFSKATASDPILQRHK